MATNYALYPVTTTFSTHHIDSGLAPHTHHGGVARNALDAEFFPDVIKEHIAGFSDRVVQTQCPVPFLFVARERVPIKRRITGAINVAQRVERSRFQSGGG